MGRCQTILATQLAYRIHQMADEPKGVMVYAENGIRLREQRSSAPSMREVCKWRNNQPFSILPQRWV